MVPILLIIVGVEFPDPGEENPSSFAPSPFKFTHSLLPSAGSLLGHCNV